MANKKFPRLFRPVLLCCVGLHLSISGVYNMWASLEGWCRTRSGCPEHTVFHAVRENTRRLALSPVVKHYAQVAGLNTGYTFFAPQVGSFYHYEAAALHGASDTHVIHHPRLKGSEGHLRYQNFLGVFQALLSSSDDPLEQQEKRYARAIAKSMGPRLLDGASTQQWRLDVSAYATRPLRAKQGSPLVTLVTLYADTLSNTFAYESHQPISLSF